MPLKYEVASADHGLGESELFCADTTVEDLFNCRTDFTLDECAKWCGFMGSTHFQYGKQGRAQNCLCKFIDSSYTKVASSNWDIYRLGTEAYSFENTIPNSLPASGNTPSTGKSPSGSDKDEDSGGALIVVIICLVVILFIVAAIVIACLLLRRKRKRQGQGSSTDDSQTKSMKESSAESLGMSSSADRHSAPPGPPPNPVDVPQGASSSPPDVFRDAPDMPPNASAGPFDNSPAKPKSTSSTEDNSAVTPKAEPPVDERQKSTDSKWDMADTDAIFQTADSLTRMKAPPNASGLSVPEHSHWKRATGNQKVVKQVVDGLFDSKDLLKR